jgi:PAS domain S-box-containing protein
VASLDLRQSTIFSRLRGLLEVTRLVRTGVELPELLSAIARTVSDSLAFRTVVINLYRREWDDFVVTTVYGSEEARKALLGQVRQVSAWDALLDSRFLQRGAYLLPSGEFDWTQHLDQTYTPDLPVSDDPNAWHPDDALFVPMRGVDGELLGVLSVDEPISGRKPAGDEIDVLVAVSEHAALAVQGAQEATRAKANREALTHLLAVSARLNESTDTHELLQHVSEAISEALGFGKVAVQLLNRVRGTYESVAETGFGVGENLGHPLSVDDVERLLANDLVEDCLLLPSDEARSILPARDHGYRSQLNGRGPHAWQNHWLFVPLYDRRGRVGYIWADDPLDRLLPEPERLRILRAFANQAMTALEQAAQFEAIQDSHAHQRALIEASPVAIIDFDFDGRVRSWNAGAADTFGWTADEAIGRVSPIVPADELDYFIDNLEHVRDTGAMLRDLDHRRLHRDGTLIDVSTSAGPICNAHGEVVGVISLMVDVTARKRSERALAASEGRKDAILRAALDCLVIADHEGLITEINPAAEETFGWTRAEAIGRSFLELAIAAEHREELAKIVASGSGPLLGARLEVTALRSDRRSFAAEVAITRVDVPGPFLFAVSLCDVTKRRRREERLREAEAKYRTLVEQLPIATYINEIGMPVRTRYMSPQIETMLGFPVSDWLEPGFFASRLHPEDTERVLAEIERTHERGDAFRLEYRLTAADGRNVWVLDETVAVRDEEYRPLFLQGFLVDVSDRHADGDTMGTNVGPQHSMALRPAAL